MRERDSCRQHGPESEPRTVDGDADDPGVRDCESQGRALGEEWQEQEEDWGFCRVIGREMAFEGADWDVEDQKV